MPEVFRINSNYSQVREVFVGYWPKRRQHGVTHYISIDEIELNWWGATDNTARIDYGYFRPLEYAEAIAFSMEGIYSEKPLRVYDPASPFLGSKYIDYFSVIFFPPPLLLDKLSDPNIYTRTGEIRGEEWRWEAHQNWLMGLDTSRWLYFRFVGNDPYVEVNIRVQGQERSFESGAKNNFLESSPAIRKTFDIRKKKLNGISNKKYL